MPDSPSDLQTELDELRARRRKTAGIRSTTFSDQSTTFDAEGLDRRIAQLEQQLAATAGRSTTRYVSTTKGA